MKLIEYRIVFTEGTDMLTKVRARSINSGFRKATDQALSVAGTSTKYDGNRRWEIARVEFSQVLS